MPFDVATETPAIRRARLIEALRGEMRGWRWDYLYVDTGCGTAGCALGLARRMWPEMDGLSTDEEAKFLGLRESDFFDVFFGLCIATEEPITPAMVADALEAIG